MRYATLGLLIAFAASPAIAQIALPITFDESINYETRGFGGAEPDLVADPADASNTVAEFVRTAEAVSFAGVAVADESGLSEPIPFAEGATTMSLRVWTPEAGTPIRLKLETLGENPASVETQVNSTQAGAWEVLVFDFSREVTGAPIDFDTDYRKPIVFFDFGLEGAPEATTYYWEDLAFGGEAPPPIELPITFDASIDYELNPFEGAESRLVADPTNADNTVAEFVRTAGAGVPAGVTVADRSGFSVPIPFADGATTMSARVWTPEANTPVRLKVEKVGDPTVSVETQTTSTLAGQWETLVFDFADEVTGTAELNFASEYTKASIFFDFGLEGATEATTYYWEDLAFGSNATSGEPAAAFDGVRLMPNAPNPFAETTTIRFETPRAERVAVHVYSLLGRRVATLFEGTLSAGDHEVVLDAADLASGTYLYRLEYGTASITRSLTVAR